MKIEIIIPNFNGFKLIKQSLSKVFDAGSNYKNNFIIAIVDDASDKEDFLQLKEFVDVFNTNHAPPVRLLRHEKNLGFASACNTGAFQSTADILVFINSDVVPEEGFLHSIIRDFEKDDSLFGIGCMDESIEADKTVLRGRGVGKWSSGMFVHSRGEVDSNTTLWISGGSCAIRRDIFIKLGGYDELYNPFYWEDIDLSYKAQKMGFGVLFEKESVVVHKHEKGSIKSHYSQKQVKIISYRNQFIFIWKNITDFDLLLSHLFFLPFHIVKAFIRADAEFLEGFFLAMLRIPAIMLKRIQFSGRIKVSDKEILRRFKLP